MVHGGTGFDDPPVHGGGRPTNDGGERGDFVTFGVQAQGMVSTLGELVRGPDTSRGPHMSGGTPDLKGAPPASTNYLVTKRALLRGVCGLGGRRRLSADASPPR